MKKTLAGLLLLSAAIASGQQINLNLRGRAPGAAGDLICVTTTGGTLSHVAKGTTGQGFVQGATCGAWGTLGFAGGGTGGTSFAANSVIYSTGSVFSAIAAGSAGQPLLYGTPPAYATLGYFGGGTNNTASYTAGSVIFADSTKLTQNNPKFFWDNTLFRLGIGTATPFTGYTLLTSGVHVSSVGGAELFLEADTSDTVGHEDYNPRVRFSQDAGGVTARLGLGTGTYGNSFEIVNEYDSTAVGPPDTDDLVFGVRNAYKMRLQGGTGYLGVGPDPTPRALINAIKASAPTSRARADSYAHLGGAETTLNSYRLLSFGVTGSSVTNYPAAIGFKQTSTTSNTLGDVCFFTRSVTTDTAPTMRSCVTSTGEFRIYGTTSGSVAFRSNAAGDDSIYEFPATAPVVGQVLGVSAVSGGVVTLAAANPASNDDTTTHKNAVRVATTANGTLASAYTNTSVVDGVTLATGDRILLKDQTTGADNGIYTVNASGAPTRATDADTSAKLKSGTSLFVTEGTVNADKLFELTTNGVITPGSTSQTWTVYTGTAAGVSSLNTLTGALTIAAGTGVTVTPSGGNTLTIANAAGATANITTTGHYAAIPTPGTTGGAAGDLFYPDDTIGYFRSTGSAWERFVDEMKMTDPLLQTWVWQNQGTATVDTTKGGIIMTIAAAAADSVKIYEFTPPATPYTVTAAILPDLDISATAAAIGIGLKETGTGKLYAFGVGVDATGGAGTANIAYISYKYTSPTVFSAAYFSGVKLMSTFWFFSRLIWLRITDDGTNRISYISKDGLFWIQTQTISRTDFLTPARVFIFANNKNSKQQRFHLLSLQVN